MVARTTTSTTSRGMRGSSSSSSSSQNYVQFAFLLLVNVWITFLAVPTKADTMNLLMVGNSFSDSHNMEEMIQTMLEERKMMLQTDSIFAARFEVGGANMTHYANSKDFTTTLNERPWTWVILQEQSQIPGFCGDGKTPATFLPGFKDSLKSVMTLDSQIEKNGATTVLFETWGYYDKDPYNPSYFPNYSTMQDKLTNGYKLYHSNILQKNPNANVKIAPAGLAFQKIYNTIQARNEDPHTEGTLFEQLFMKVEDHPTPDHNKARKYPTLAGAYLCGCVLFQTLTGLDVRKSSFTPLGMKPEMRIMMQKVAYDTVVEFQGGGGDDSSSSKVHYDMMDSLSTKTKPPYNPSTEYKSDYTSSSSDATKSSSSFGRWVLATILMGGGLASYWMAAKKRREAAGGFGFGATTASRDYGWNPLASTDDTRAMELSDVSINLTSSGSYNSPPGPNIQGV